MTKKLKTESVEINEDTKTLTLHYAYVSTKYELTMGISLLYKAMSALYDEEGDELPPFAFEMACPRLKPLPKDPIKITRQADIKRS